MAPIFAAMALAGGIALTASANAADDVVIVYDASGSMWGQIDGTSKMEIAQDVMADLVNEWNTATNLGLVAYGHRRQGDCSDIETLIEPGPLDKANFIDTVNAIKPRGKTPISASVQHAADLLSYRDSPATVVLVSDGLETCNADPCALSQQLAKQGVSFTAHVVGFDLEDDAHASLACIADNTGGIFVPASNAAELHAALDQVQSAMDQKPDAPEPEPEPEPEAPALPDVDISGPEQATTGATFDVSWSTTISSYDIVTIVPAGDDEGAYNNHLRAKENVEGRLRAPAEPGLYELRYVLNEGKKTLATAPIEVVDAEVELRGPEQATTGATFDVSWSTTISSYDIVTIVPAGADEGAYNNHLRAKENVEGRLRAPAEPGLYELRYVLNEGKKTLATAPIEVVDAEVELRGPEQATTGATFDVSWSTTISSYDIVTIVPAGADEGAYNNHLRAKENVEGRLRAPAEPGLYELRYILNEGKKTLATAPIEVVDAEVELRGPEQATTGATFDVSWSTTISSYDIVTIVPAGADEGAYNNHLRAKENVEGRLRAPAEPGLYELRYILNEGKKTLATAPIEVVEAEVEIFGPAIVRAGNEVDISWTETISGYDIVTIVPAGADKGAYNNHLRAKENVEGRLRAPAEPGLYELRYILNEGKQMLASAPLEVVGKDAPLDDGAGLSVPKNATPGETISVSWTGENDSADQRIAIARKDQADFSWIAVESVGEEKTLDMTLPDEAGYYEIRYLDVTGRKLLGRSVVTVE